MNAFDTLIQQVCPTVMVPRHEPLALMENDGHRFLMGSDAFYVEVRRPWLHAIIRLGDTPVALPYGQPPLVFDLHIDRHALVGGLRHFIEQARAVAPLEHAAWLMFNPATKGLDYTEPVILSRSNGHIRYERPEASATSLPAIDAHSHGTFKAFFSQTDQKDDLNDDAKLAFVVGSLDQPYPSIAMRLVGLGFSLDISEFAASLLYDEGIISNRTEEALDHA